MTKAALLQESLGTGVWLTIVINLALADWLVNRRLKMSMNSEPQKSIPLALPRVDIEIEPG